MNEIELRRRQFLLASAALGGGLVLGFYIPFRGAPIAAAAEPPPLQPNAWLRIAEDGQVRISVAKSEMGQGVWTSMPMLVAEELDADWALVEPEQAEVAPVYYHTIYGVMVTGGSSSVSSSWEQLRTVGAAARQMLLAAAARRWAVPAAECRTEPGIVLHPPSGRRLGYGALAAAAAQEPLPTAVQLKDPKTFRLIGRSPARLDTPAKIRGSARFGLDVQRPGLLVALVARPPVFGGSVRSLRAARAKQVPGVRTVAQIPSGVAVIAADLPAALQGRQALEIEWDLGPEPQLSSAALLQEYRQLAEQPGTVARKDGDPAQALQQAAKTLSAEYDVPYLAHACMEPLNCTVELGPHACEIWTGSQFQSVDRDAAAKAAGLKPEQVRLHTTFLGGGFGRRANPASDFVVEAVEVAKVAKAPVKLIWTREDDMQGGWYRPLWYSRLEGGLDETGNPVAWSHRIVGQSIMRGTPFEASMAATGFDGTSVEGAMDLPYAIPNLLVDLHSPQHTVPVQWWRSVGHSHTAFVTECFLDELARAAGQDPFAFRRRLLAGQPRHRAVLERVAAMADWQSPLPKGRGRGIAVHKSFGSYIAQAAEVSLDDRGQISVHRVFCAVDCGRVVHPDTIKAQMEGGIIFGLSAALFGAITLKEGRVQEENFDRYPLLRLEESPQIEVQIVESVEAPSGIGEPGVPPIAPAVANALFAASGVRLRQLPLTPERIQAALGKG
jgi:isoquinoline 1-oxidoreductase subunit beta